MKKKYYCKMCKYETDRLFNFNKHKKSKKHINNVTTFTIPKNGDSYPNFGTKYPKNGEKIAKKVVECIECEFCNKPISYKKHVKRHYKTCIKYKEHLIKQEKNSVIDELKNELQQKEEELEELKDIEKEFMDFMKKVSTAKIEANNNSNIKQVNMFFIVKTYIKAKNCEDLMAPPLTEKEIEYVHENGGVYGGYNILINRCVNGLEMEERPFHCVDASRDKYMLRTNDVWQIDRKGRKILEFIYPKMLQLCCPKQITSPDQLEEWSKYNKYMVELSNNGEGKILKMLNEVTLLKNNVAIE